MVVNAPPGACWMGEDPMYHNQQRLNAEQNEALVVAAVMLIERCLGDVRRLSAGRPLDEGETVLGDELDDAAEECVSLDLRTFRDGVVEDEDYLLLWTDQFDVQDRDRDNTLGMGGLRFTEWFSHFRDEDWNVHPVASWPHDWDWTSGPGMPKPPRA